MDYKFDYKIELALAWEDICWNEVVVAWESINLYAFSLYNLPKVITLVDTFQPISQVSFVTLLKDLNLKAFLVSVFFL